MKKKKQNKIKIKFQNQMEIFTGETGRKKTDRKRIQISTFETNTKTNRTEHTNSNTTRQNISTSVDKQMLNRNMRI